MKYKKLHNYNLVYIEYLLSAPALAARCSDRDKYLPQDSWRWHIVLFYHLFSINSGQTYSESQYYVIYFGICLYRTTENANKLYTIPSAAVAL